MSKRIKHVVVLLAMAGLLGAGMGTAAARADGVPVAYNYSFWGDTVSSPAPYLPAALLNGRDLGVGPFKEPNDLFVTADGDIYVLDSGNNRIVVLDRQLQPASVIDSFVRDGHADTFANPQGIFVTDDKEVLIADTGNRRIVHLDRQLHLVKVIESPESELLPANFVFQPVRIAADKAQRLYVLAVGVFDGFMEFNADGTFTSFIGANRVRVDPVELFWKRISTREQRSRMVLFVPTEFTSLDMNEEGFIYATNGDQWGETIKKLNAHGNDILRREGYFSPRGDIRYTASAGPSRLVDIDVADSEIYSVLDAKRGRIFTYNGDGHLMYVFGGLGNKRGEFNTPVAIERLGDDFLVLDKALGEITLFQVTEYGSTLNEAVRSYYRGDEERAVELFRKAVDMNANLEFAYSGIGKALLRQGKYAEAMQYFKLSMDQRNYSKAFQLRRKEVLREYLPAVLSAAMAVTAGLLLLKKLRKMLRRKGAATLE
ncbi:MAG: hypothetical protein C6W59_12590 [Paenibacillaceae bacterium]|nr:MAG: hypothetical protein C6W59_12590 [Paenibacillaceae bacterium]